MPVMLSNRRGKFGGQKMKALSGWLILHALVLVFLGGCAPLPSAGQPGIDGAVPITFDPELAPLPRVQPVDAGALGLPAAEKLQEYNRNNLAAHYIRESEVLCSAYIQQLTRVDRDSNLIFGTLSTVLGGLGAAFTQAAVVRPLSAAAGIASGVRAEFDAATFAHKTADIIAGGIVNARARLYNDMVVNKFPQTIQAWPVELALADVQNYHSKCSLYGGLMEASEAVVVAPVNPPPPPANANQPTGRPTGPADAIRAMNANLVAPVPTRPGSPQVRPSPASRPFPKPVANFAARLARFVRSNATDDTVAKIMTQLSIPPVPGIPNDRIRVQTEINSRLRSSDDPTQTMNDMISKLSGVVDPSVLGR
jgi:hypothetical protein